MPYHTKDGKSKGLMRRTCTDEYKIQPIERYIRRSILKLRKYQHAPKGAVRHWFGISSDERQRVRVCKASWEHNYYPLVKIDREMQGVEFGNSNITRDDCVDYLEARGFGDTPRSACVGCPFRSDDEWRALSATDFAEAVEFDEQMRNVDGMDSELYLHRSRMPLGGIDFSVDQMYRNGQQSLFDEVRHEECTGLCGN